MADARVACLYVAAVLQTAAATGALTTTGAVSPHPNSVFKGI